FFWHVASAFSLGAVNGAREGLQIAIVMLFAITLLHHLPNLNYARLGKLILVGFAAVMAFNIGWHLINGYWTGWKRLTDAQSTFTFLPMVVICFILCAAPERKRFYWLAWWSLAPLIVLSGERKALIIFGILSASLLGRGRLQNWAPFAAIAYVVLAA